jgi:hypothetical protein
MAIKSMVATGKYAVCETPDLAARKIGGSFLKNQYELDGTDFATIKAENGMLLAVDEVGKKVKLPTNATTYSYLHCSPVKDYEGKGKDTVAVGRNELLPAMYKLSVGDTIITNAVKYDDGVYANVAAIAAAINGTTVFGAPNADGYIRVAAAAGGSDAVSLKALSVTTLANGTSAIKFAVVKA